MRTLPRKTLRFWAALGLGAGLALLAGCSREKPSLTLATTTSTRDSGLLKVLVPLFEEETGIEVKVVAVGTGQALELGRRGDADVLWVHDPAAEEKFMGEGFGALRRPVMYNDFVLVGPEADPARVKRQASIAEAFTRIARKKATFVSRGDKSGTHQKEREIWRKARIEPRGKWYKSSGDSMAGVLRLADHLPAYTLSDRGTYLAQRQKAGLKLTILGEGDPLLLNKYSVIVVNPDKHPHVREPAARKFADFLLAAKTQKAIAEYGTDRYGQPLFFVGEPGKKPPPR
jgi:tungstate transport system substrate-binding protein